MGFTADRLQRVDSTTTTLPYFTLSQSGSTQRLAIDNAGALFSNAFLAAEQAKARAIGSLPVHVYQDGDRGREKVRGHPLAALCQERWNPLMTACSGWQWANVRRDTFGTAYVRVEWSSTRPIAFWPVEVPVETHYDPISREAVYIVRTGDRFTPAGPYLSREMLKLPTCISTDGGVTGRSLAELGATEIGLNIDLTRFYATVVSKGFSPGGYLSHDDDLSDEEVRAIARKNAMLSGPEHAGEVRIFDKGLKYTAINSSMVEADIIKQEEFILQSVIRAVYVQPNKVFDYSRATFSNIEESNIAFVTDTITSEVTGYESEVRKLFHAMGEHDKYIKFDLRGLQRGSFKDQAEGFKTGIYASYYTPAEVREWLDLPYIEGTDERMVPVNYYTIDPLTGEAKEAPSAAPSAQVLAPVLAGVRSRIAARASRDGDIPKTREWARGELATVAQAFALAGVVLDLEHEIEEAING